MAIDPYRTLVRNASDIVAISTDDATLLWIGPSVSRALGYEAEGLIGRNCLDLLHPEDRDRAVAFEAVLDAPGVPSDPIELRFRAADGSWRWFEAILTNLKDDPSIGGVVVNARDITDRVEALAALQDSELRFRGFASAVPLGLMFVDQDGRLTYANDRWYEITGVARDDVRRGVWLELVHPEERGLVTASLEILLSGEGVLDQVHRILRPDGATVWIRSRVAQVQGPAGDVRGYAAALEDVTADLEALAATEQLANTIDACTEYILIVSGDGRIMYANSAVRAMASDDPSPGTFSRDLADLIGGEGYDAYIARVIPDLFATGHWEGEMLLRTRDGSEIPILQSAHAHFDPDGQLRYVAAIGKDIRERKALEAELADRERQYRALAEHASDVVTVNDARGIVLYVSPSVREASGFEPEELVGRPGFEMIHPDDRHVLEELGARVAAPGATGSALYRVRRKDGGYHWVEGLATNLVLDPAIGGWLVTARNVDDRHRAEMLLADQARILELVARREPMDATLGAVAQLVHQWVDTVCAAIVLNVSGHLHLAATAGMPPELRAQLTSATVPVTTAIFEDGSALELDFASLETQPRIRDAVLPYGISRGWLAPISEPGTGAYVGGVVACTRDGFQLASSDRDLLALAANIAGICVQGARDAQRLAHQARHDALTGLPNRGQVLEHIRDAVALPERSGTLAVLFLDLDRFKVLNDSLGHAVGDELLNEIAQRLRRAVRPGDLVARFGGDEFVISCPQLRSHASAIEIAERLLEVVEQPLGPAGSHIVVTASIGIAIDHGLASPESLVRDADAAMYRAKESGRAQWALFDDRLRSRVVRRLEVERELRNALEQGELELYYQPAVALGWNTMLGFEALLRWNHPRRGVLEPAAFLEIAEDSGLAHPIGVWVLEEACRQTMDWLVRFPEWGSFMMGANVSTRLLGDRTLPRRVGEILDRTGMLADHLVLEITEHALGDDAAVVRSSLEQLDRLGIFLALDDFGTGSSNLTQLRELPIQTLKIDRSFVDELLEDPEDAAIVASIVDLARNLDLFVVAAGVETEAQAAKLQELGVGMAQGHRWSPPLPAAEVEAFLAESAIRFAPPRSDAHTS